MGTMQAQNRVARFLDSRDNQSQQHGNNSQDH
jgi:hypothetical protein